MGELTAGVSWAAVVVGFVLSFLVGWLWHSPRMFGRRWAEGARVDMNTAGMPMFPLITQALGTFGLAWLFGVTAAENRLLTIILIVLTFILLLVSNGKYAQKSTAAVSIEGGYVLAMAVIMFVCQGVL